MAAGIKINLTRKPAITDLHPGPDGVIPPRNHQNVVEAIRKRLEDIELAMLSATAQLNQMVKTMAPASAPSATTVETTSVQEDSSNLDSAIAALGWNHISPPSLSSVVPAGTGGIWFGPTATIPDGWSSCFNQLLLIADYPDLFAAIGTTWGGDGVTNFRLPDTDGRFLASATVAEPLGTVFGNANNSIDLQHKHPFGILSTLLTEPEGGVAATSTGDNSASTMVQFGIGPTVAAYPHSHAIDAVADHQHEFSGTTEDAEPNPVLPVPGLSNNTDIRPMTASIYWIIKL